MRIESMPVTNILRGKVVFPLYRFTVYLNGGLPLLPLKFYRLY